MLEIFEKNRKQEMRIGYMLNNPKDTEAQVEANVNKAYQKKY
jgi:t-SNARE complex subunit (syntaxin)